MSSRILRIPKSISAQTQSRSGDSPSIVVHTATMKLRSVCRAGGRCHRSLIPRTMTRRTCTLVLIGRTPCGMGQKLILLKSEDFPTATGSKAVQMHYNRHAKSNHTKRQASTAEEESDLHGHTWVWVMSSSQARGLRECVEAMSCRAYGCFWMSGAGGNMNGMMK
ncbi:hypothetical protein M3J09_013069 [Ascochyta lentis]